MSTRFVRRSAGGPNASTGSAAGIGVDTNDDVLKWRVGTAIRKVLVDHSPGTTYYVDTVNGADSRSGKSWAQAFATMDKAFDTIVSNDTIIFKGDVREQLVAPLGVYNVAIIGLPTTGRAHDDNAARWREPASATTATPLLKLREQGWTLANFLMSGLADASAACVEMKRREDATDPDPSHAQFLGMRFVGGKYGIQDNGGCHNYLVDGCTFQSQTGSGGGGIVCTSTTIAVPLRNEIRNSRFFDNQSNILSSLSFSIIADNYFDTGSASQINTTHNSGQGGNNHVVRNTFNIAAADFDPAGGVTGASTDVWSNTLSDAIETGQPAD